MLTLENLSNIDGLTQIHNRRSFDEYLDREFLRSERGKLPISIAMIDIDHFKLYNDSYGHQAGDDCLRVVAQSLPHILKRPGDMAFRNGGEEFGVILPYTNLEGAMVIGDMLRANIEALQIPHKASLTAKYVTVSIGVATWDDGGGSKKELLDSVDKALYQAKANGRNCVMVYRAEE